MFYEFTKGFKVFESSGSVFPLPVTYNGSWFSPYFFTGNMKIQKENNPHTVGIGI